MKIGALIPIRLGSERLPGKALMDIAGQPAVHLLLDRMFASRHLAPENVVVCTTEEPEDDALVPAVEARGARVFRGARDDIIDRFYEAAKLFHFDIIMQADGDDPLTDTEYMDLCVDRLVESPDLDIVYSDGLPLGLNSKAFRWRALEKVRRHRLTTKNDHGFILYFTETGLCRVGVVKPTTADHVHATARITLDYAEDLTFFDRLVRTLVTEKAGIGVRQIVTTLKRHPELVAINSFLNEEYWERTDALVDLKFDNNGQVEVIHSRPREDPPSSFDVSGAS